ncbi:MAG: hypothetical protein P8R42_24840 [Candidatus Binatia bacterium]|nr:hypothetical protein [Candidatus Binatia bacterium]
MPLHFVIDETISLVSTTAVGDVAEADLLAHAMKLAAVPDRPRREFVDFTDRTGATRNWVGANDAATRQGQSSS